MRCSLVLFPFEAKNNNADYILIKDGSVFENWLSFSANFLFLQNVYFLHKLPIFKPAQ
jgi:hypothetical protein